MANPAQRKDDMFSKVEVDSQIWEDRPKTRIIKWLMKRGGMDQELMAEYLGCKKPYLDNKMSRDSFTIDELLIAAYSCGYSVALTKKDELSNIVESHDIDIVDYFRNCDDDVLAHISKIEKTQRRQKKKEYEQKKAELAKMKEVYGFED